VRAFLEQGLRPVALLATEQALDNQEISDLIKQSGVSPVLLASAVFKGIADAETPQGIAAEIEIPKSDGRDGRPGDHVFLEGIQDAGNVGAILRSAAAFGVTTVVMDRACADPWSPKALRAAMGGHFSVAIRHVEDLKKEIDAFRGHIACTVPRDGVNLKDVRLSHPLGWLFGGEGRGVSEALQELSDVRVTIPLAPGMESLNVAAAAAICLYEALQ
jgi:TrmH family RNA methyltransferase